MKAKNRFLICSLVIMSLGLGCLNAQNLYVKEKAGAQTSLALSDISKLSFASGIITINKTDGSTSDFTISDLRYLSFLNYSVGVAQTKVQPGFGISLYPNPVQDQLYISYESAKSDQIEMFIYNIQGKLMHQERINIQSGVNHSIINVSDLTGGLYIFRLQKGNKIETIKFTKN